jgi:RNA recognition motif-containing protein
MSLDTEPKRKSRKRSPDEAELEIDVNAPEPPSKKALRKAKKQKTTVPEKAAEQDQPQSSNDVDLKRLNGLEGERSKYGVWIGNLLFTVGKKELFKFLTENNKSPIPGDQITRIHLPAGRDHRAQNKGFAYVDFTEQQWVDVAISLSETLMTGRPLLIKDAHNFTGRPETSKTRAFVESQAKPPNRKLFIGNLPFDTTVSTLEKHFAPCGIITKTHVATFEDSGKCKGYAWVEFESLSSAETAMKGQTTIDAPKAPSGRKTIYLSRMGDSKLRMEYAEDSTTRYNKRYGKTAKDGHGASESTAEGGDESATPQHKTERTRQHRDRPRDGSHKAQRREQKEDSRYGAETVQKLTGAIVEATGKKVTFD